MNFRGRDKKKERAEKRFGELMGEMHKFGKKTAAYKLKLVSKMTSASKGTKKEFSLLVETVTWSGHLENNFIKQLEIKLPCDAGILPLGI